jgi:hypothetical protein
MIKKKVKKISLGIRPIKNIKIQIVVILLAINIKTIKNMIKSTNIKVSIKQPPNIKTPNHSKSKTLN